VFWHPPQWNSADSATDNLRKPYVYIGVPIGVLFAANNWYAKGLWRFVMVTGKVETSDPQLATNLSLFARSLRKSSGKVLAVGIAVALICPVSSFPISFGNCSSSCSCLPHPYSLHPWNWNYRNTNRNRNKFYAALMNHIPSILINTAEICTTYKNDFAVSIRHHYHYCNTHDFKIYAL